MERRIKKNEELPWSNSRFFNCHFLLFSLNEEDKWGKFLGLTYVRKQKYCLAVNNRKRSKGKKEQRGKTLL
jgi:hypothetical protein